MNRMINRLLALLLAPAVPAMAWSAEPMPAAAGDQSAPVVAPKDSYARFASEIAAFQRQDKDLGIVNGGTLFLGSSSIRRWDVAAGFPAFGPVNHGFGGSETPDVLFYYPQIVSVYRPAAVVVYIGENDIAHGAAPERVSADVLTLLARLRSDLPQARIAFLSLKPGNARWGLWAKMQQVNAAVKARAEGAGDFDYLDVGTPLLGTDGRPDDRYFLEDRIHLNADGYAVWNLLVDAYLEMTPPVPPQLAGGERVAH